MTFQRHAIQKLKSLRGISISAELLVARVLEALCPKPMLTKFNNVAELRISCITQGMVNTDVQALSNALGRLGSKLWVRAGSLFRLICLTRLSTQRFIK